MRYPHGSVHRLTLWIQTGAYSSAPTRYLDLKLDSFGPTRPSMIHVCARILECRQFSTLHFSVHLAQDRK